MNTVETLLFKPIYRGLEESALRRERIAQAEGDDDAEDLQISIIPVKHASSGYNIRKLLRTNSASSTSGNYTVHYCYETIATKYGTFSKTADERGFPLGTEN